MADPRFYDSTGPLTLETVAKVAGAQIGDGASASLLVHDIAPLESAAAGQLAYCDAPKYREQLARSKAAAVLVPRGLKDAVPPTVAALICERPNLAFAEVAAALYPDAGVLWPRAHPPVMAIDPSVKVGEGTIIAPNVFIAAGAEIGRDCIIGPGTVIGRGVQIGHGCRLGPHVSIVYALLGDRVVVDAGTRIGQDGFGYIGGPKGHRKIAQLGRVIIQDSVEIGANVCIDRGALSDTVIGEGTKIDNLVQIGHNCRVGRHCILVAEVGLSGSIELGDFVVLGGQVGIADHVKIGAGARVAARGGVTSDLGGGQAYGGFPAKPVSQWRRELAALSLLAKGKYRKNVSGGGSD